MNRAVAVAMAFGPAAGLELVFTVEDPQWTVLPTARGATEYVDSDFSQWTDGARYSYRITAVKGVERSAPASVSTGFSAPLFPPVILSATAVSGAVRLTFQNQSRAATTLTIYRRGGPDYDDRSIASGPAPRPGVIMQYDDRGVGPATYVYAIVASIDHSGGSRAEQLVTVP